MSLQSDHRPARSFCEAAGLGRSLRPWRLVRRIKQSHAAELLGVSQATVSRWESGAQLPTLHEQAALRGLMQARLDSAGDRALARLVTGAAAPVHLVCDLTHNLLAASPARVRDWSIPVAQALGTSLWRYATPEIARAEAELTELGWFEAPAPVVVVETGPNQSHEVPISAGRMSWVRLQLSDGSFVRLVEPAA